MEKNLYVTDIFYSLQGESTYSGYPVFLSAYRSAIYGVLTVILNMPLAKEIEGYQFHT